MRMRPHFLFALALLPGLPAAAAAAPIYHYTYESGLSTSGLIGERFTIDIWSPTQLGIGSLSTAGVTARGTALGTQIDFPLPPPTISCQPNPWEPEGGCVDMPDYPYATSSLSLAVSSLDASGLPSGWELSLHGSWVSSWRFNDTAILLLDSFYSNEGSYVDYMLDRGGLIAGNDGGNRGSWSLAITEVPAPPTLLLAGCALAVLGLTRRRTHTT
ncbi:MAG: hypothetical protein REI94_09030 [Moraxellaceae bacterium]|nr:hypothetical protein [Moraxellaceae bacterium]